jgi:hypothetical protein
MAEAPFTVTDVRLRLLDRPNSEDGLIGWASCIVNHALYLNNIAVHKRPDGEFEVRYPARPGRRGKVYHHYCPLNEEAADLLRRAVLRHLAV